MCGPRVGGSDPTTAGIWNAKQAFTYDAPKKRGCGLIHIL